MAVPLLPFCSKKDGVFRSGFNVVAKVLRPGLFDTFTGLMLSTYANSARS